MLCSSIESANPSVVLATATRTLPDPRTDSVKDSAAAVSPQQREEERSSPVCAALWAY